MRICLTNINKTKKEKKEKEKAKKWHFKILFFGVYSIKH